MVNAENLVGKVVWLDVGLNNMNKVLVENVDEVKVFLMFINEKIDYSYGVMPRDIFERDFISIISDSIYGDGDGDGSGSGSVPNPGSNYRNC